MAEKTKKSASQPSTQKLVPYLLYKDVGKALGWLTKAFGFVEFGLILIKGGKVTQAYSQVPAVRSFDLLGKFAGSLVQRFGFFVMC